MMSVVAEVASVASIIPGPIGMVAAGVSAVAYAASGDLANAALMTAGIALAAVGAGAAVVAVKAVKTGVKVGTAIAKAAPKAERAFNAVKTVASKVKASISKVRPALARSKSPNWARDAVTYWDKGTFPNLTQSIIYHHSKHALPGQTVRHYVEQGVRLARKVGATGSRVKVKGSGGGIVSPRGKTWTTW